MAVDLEKLKARLAQINGNTNDGKLIKFAKAGKVTVRIIDSGQAPDGDLFPFRDFISLGKDRMVVSQNTNVRNYISKLQTKYFDLAGKKGSENFDKDFFQVAKDMYPDSKWFATVIVRGEEGKGVQVWKLNKGVYTELVEAFTNEDIGDFMDPKRGYDVDITVTKGKNGNYFYAEHAEVARKTSPLSTDADQMRAWISEAREVNIDEFHRKAIKTDEEVIEALDNFVSGGASNENERTSDERVSRDVSKELDDLVDEVAPPKKKAAAKKQDDDEEDAPENVKSDLDSQFADIMADD